MATWRQAMGHIRARRIPQSRESVQELTRRALVILEDLAADADANDRRLMQLPTVMTTFAALQRAAAPPAPAGTQASR